MLESPVFDWMSLALEEVTPWNALSARGTVRLALKKAGLDARSVNKLEMIVVVDRLLERELQVRGIENAAQVCTDLRGRLEKESFAAAAYRPARPEEVFSRVLGGSPLPAQRPGSETGR
jgi:hypothetical protein